MLKTLKFVKGGVGNGKTEVTYAHFHVADGRITAYNGMTAVSAPIDLPDCRPDAVQFAKAIQRCEDVGKIDVKLTPTGKVSIKAGKFKAMVASFPGRVRPVVPEGDPVPVAGAALLKGLKQMEPFVSQDENNGWANGVLLRGKAAYATNNVILVQTWIGTQFPLECNLPFGTVKELLRVKEAPTHVSATENSITFYYPGERWIKSQLFSTKWPSNIDDMLAAKDADLKAPPVPLWEALKALAPFTDKLGRVYFRQGVARTSLDDNEGASFEVPGMPDCTFTLTMLQLIGEHAKLCDFARQPGVFHGEKIRGIITGVRA